ncbi:NUDIX domain-containing protein [Candidatus Woesearchaeota archaeon]|nr:NUDIX domain-containing protein [Candidatus Woesearchaeota archaeon]
MSKFFIGVKALIVHNGKVLLIKRSHKYENYDAHEFWDIPGGRLNFGEEPIEGLKREVYEETGLEINSIRQILDASTIHKDDNEQIIRITYLCTVKNHQTKLSDEHTEFLWVEPEKIDFKLKDKLLNITINKFITQSHFS